MCDTPIMKQSEVKTHMDSLQKILAGSGSYDSVGAELTIANAAITLDIAVSLERIANALELGNRTRVI